MIKFCKIGCIETFKKCDPWKEPFKNSSFTTALLCAALLVSTDGFAKENVVDVTIEGVVTSAAECTLAGGAGGDKSIVDFGDIKKSSVDGSIYKKSPMTIEIKCSDDVPVQMHFTGQTAGFTGANGTSLLATKFPGLGIQFLFDDVPQSYDYISRAEDYRQLPSISVLPVLTTEAVGDATQVGQFAVTGTVIVDYQ